MNKNKVAKAIKAAIKELFPYDEDVADQSVVAGDPWGWGADLATIQTEDGLSCLNYYDADWIGNSHKIEAHVKKNAGLSIFIECYNAAIHCVYEG
jgi:hypothetical protein